MVLFCHLPLGFWFGETGVDLFFVLSGFLISGIILKNREKGGFLKVFYSRRALRIFPIYYLAILGMVLVNLLRTTPGRLDGIWYYLFYIQNLPAYWGGSTPPVELSVGHTWTLAIEEQFYLIWPLVLVTLRFNRVAFLCLVLIVLPCVLRHFGLHRAALLGHTDGLAWGGLLAWLECSFATRYRVILNRAYLLLGLGGFAVYYFLWTSASASGFTGKEMVKLNGGIAVLSFAYAGLIGLVAAMSANRWLAVLRWRPLVHLGAISYGLYLYHWIIYEYLDTFIKFGLKMGDPWWLDVLKVLLSLGTAMLSWRFIEKPILRFKDCLQYGARLAPEIMSAATPETAV